jgi:hypothetical protein
MDRGEHPAKLKRLGRHKSFDVLGEYLEFEDLLKGIRSTACSNPAPPLHTGNRTLLAVGARVWWLTITGCSNDA